MRIKVPLADKEKFSSDFNVCDFEMVPHFCNYRFLEWISGKVNVSLNEWDKMKPYMCTAIMEQRGINMESQYF